MPPRPRIDDTPCTLKDLPLEDRVVAATEAVRINPTNAPRLDSLPALVTALSVEPQFLAAITTKFWGSRGINLGVSFLDNPSSSLRNKILAHMNAWGTDAGANVKYSWSQSQGQVRIARGNSGYWSYLGTDILQVRSGPTMNLQGFTDSTPDATFRRVVRHETGHTNGFPHEHLRAELIALLDEEKTYRYFEQTQGWSRSVTRANVLTPLSRDGILASAEADQDSIMCYQLPASITKTGKPIRGGNDLSEIDKATARKFYPAQGGPDPEEVVIDIPKAGRYVLRKE